MRIIRFTDLQQTPWKNGAGITREIATVRVGDALIWRLSIANVGVDGPFSKFDGLSRILTVIEGRGMELISPDGTLQADYAVPVSFDGALDIRSRLKDGPLRDFNLIYNPLFCRCQVAAIMAASKYFIEGKVGQIVALHCIAGSIVIDAEEQLHRGDTAIIDGDALQYVTAKGAAALQITIQAEANS
jgi:uncharacterized protein